MPVQRCVNIPPPPAQHQTWHFNFASTLPPWRGTYSMCSQAVSNALPMLSEHYTGQRNMQVQCWLNAGSMFETPAQQSTRDGPICYVNWAAESPIVLDRETPALVLICCHGNRPVFMTIGLLSRQQAMLCYDDRHAVFITDLLSHVCFHGNIPVVMTTCLL